MLGYATLGSNNMEKALEFYDALFGAMGARRVLSMEPTFYLYGRKGGDTRVAIVKPYNGEAQTAGNGNMLALPCESQDQVQVLYNKAIELGGSDEGAPGDRGQGFYGAYFRDLDGNKICFFNVTRHA